MRRRLSDDEPPTPLDMFLARLRAREAAPPTRFGVMADDDDDSKQGFPVKDESRVKEHQRELEERQREQEEIERRKRGG